MKGYEVIEFLKKEFPPRLALEWDNVGLLVGDAKNEVNKVYLTLDLTMEELNKAIEYGADMIITHHPMIFSGQKQINNDTILGEKIIKIIENKIVYYAMHTNLDSTLLGELSSKLLGLKDTKVLLPDNEDSNLGLGRVGVLENRASLHDLAIMVKNNFGLSDVRVYGPLNQDIKIVATCTGSGKSLIDDVMKYNADVYITGDIDYHTAVDSMEKGLSIIDAGHFGTEYIFMEELKKVLESKFKDLDFIVGRKSQPYTLIV